MVAEMKRHYINITPHSIKNNRLSINSTMAGVKWYIHEKDDDIKEPSCPHCHTDERPWKLNIYTRQIYDVTTKKYINKKISKKEMRHMWEQPGFLEIVLNERKRYSELRKREPYRYPPLPPLPFKNIKVKSLGKCSDSLRNRRKIIKILNVLKKKES